ncbi:MAG TPA: hypothetical protein VHB51_01305 [Candidatus Saccharimonadales bacterium]|nr:hypothetical protein [Candidatus Saccharimonadales bacterium]
MKNPGVKTLRILFQPSWLSGLVDGLVWMVVVVGGLASTHFVGSSWQLGLFNLGSSSSSTYQQLTAQVKDNRLIGNLPLFIFWLGMGLVVYYLAVAVYEAFHNVVEVREEMDYVNVRRQQLLRAAGEQLAARLISLVVWLIYIALFFKQLLPWVLTELRAASVSITAHTIEMAVLAAAVLVVGLHLHTIFLRLVVLKERVFSRATYDL